MDLMRFFETRNKIFWAAVGFVLILLLGFIDWITGFEVNVSLFYLIPIALVTWYTNRELSLVMSGLSAIVWFLADILAGNTYSVVWLYLWNTLIRLGFYLIVVLLIVSLKRSYQANQDLARIDYVTGAVSNRYFYTLAEVELGRSQRYNHPLTLAYIDLDNFKEVNDHSGHSAGDRLLRTVTDIVRRRSRNIDTFARLGGDEFALLLPETGEVEAQAVLSRIRRSLLEEMHNNNWPVTFSIGVVTFIKIPKTVDDMVKMADDVMLPVKTGGKDGVSFTIYEG